MADSIGLFVNGRRVTVPAGIAVAAAVAKAGETAFRHSVTGEPRGPVCGMGICFECRVTIDGQQHQRSCQMMCREGMRVETGAGQSPAQALGNRRAGSVGCRVEAFDVLVVGAGPAGLAAAVSASASGQSVGLVDDNPHLGGQIWRADSSHALHDDVAVALNLFQYGHVTVLSRSSVVGQERPGKLLIEQADGGTFQVTYGKLIIASGARERFLPFPGWTKPNVMGAGGLQALVKGGLPIEGKRVLVAGTGPLLMAVAAYLCKRRAHVCLVAEQAPLGRLLRFGFGLLGAPAKLWQAARLRLQFRGVPYRTGCWPVAAEGDDKLASVTFTNGRKTWSEPCDYLACGFGLVPNIELAALLGCKIENGAVAVNEWQETSVPDVYCAGEATGIGGLEKAVAEGVIAGRAATGQRQLAGNLFGKRDRALRFAQALERTFALRDELKLLATPETLVCRCEDVPYGKLRAYRSWRDAKLQTRCGMGPCQGRICGTAVEYLFGWSNASVRPPIFPTRVGTLEQSPP